MKFIKLVLFFLLAFTYKANAYIDPGMGSALISFIVGIFVFLGVFFRSTISKLKSMFNILLKKFQKTNNSK